MSDNEQKSSLAELERALGYVFSKPSHLLNGLTHRSWINEQKRPRDEIHVNNERLEFLGDAVVGVVASRLLFLEHPDAREGELTRRRADLVCEASLERAARFLNLGEYLRLSRGEEKSGGREKPRLLASAFEAVIAAIYLDGGFEVAEQVAEKILRQLLAESKEAPGHADFKSALQEWLQAAGEALPSYALISTEGPEHDRVFEMEVQAEVASNAVLARGTGKTKSAAEQDAAAILLRTLAHASPDDDCSSED